MNSSQKTTSILLLLGIAAMSASAGCGQAPGQPLVGTTTADTTAPGSVPGTGGTAGTSTFGNSPNYDFHFDVTGPGTATQVGGGGLTVTTDTLLQITLTAGNGGQRVGQTGFTAGYNCEMFTVKVGNVSQSAFVAVPGYQDYMFNYAGYSDPCATAPTAWNYDFSSALGVQHTGGINIIINQAKYDNCRTNTNPNLPYGTVAADYGGCGPMTGVYYSDSIDGYAQVFTD